MESIYLCGFMGCGKTHIGRRLAKKLNLPFVDLDEYIVQKENRSIPAIFDQDGEEYFRQLEAKCIKELSDGYVVATGGGTLINKSTAEYANAHGITVFLDVPFSVCYGRIKDDKNRPLVVKNTKEQLKELFEKRRVIYGENSRLTVKASGPAIAIVNRVINQSEKLRKNKG